MTKIRVGVVNLFYKGFIHEEENYVVVKQERVYFGSEETNKVYRLDDNTVRQVIFTNPMQKVMMDALKMIPWSEPIVTSRQLESTNSYCTT